MRFSQIAGVIATGSVGANAFLLPPTISKPDTDILSALPPVEADFFVTEEVIVRCTGCEVAVGDITGEANEVSTQVINSLAFNINILPDAADRLTINGVQIYPVEPTVEGLGSILKADQWAKQGDRELGLYRATPVLGYMLSSDHVAAKPEQDMAIVNVHFEVVQVDNKDVSIPSMDIKLLETPSGKLMLSMIKLHSPPAYKAGQCTTAICKFKAMIANKWSKLKGCGRKPLKHSTPRPNIQVGSDHAATHGVHVARPRPHSSRPASGMTSSVHSIPHHKGAHHHGHGHGHGRHGGFGRFIGSFMSSLVFHVLVPIFLGVALGVAASVVGLIVGHLAIFLWRLVFRRNLHSEYEKVEQTEAAEGKDDSEALLTPPVYEEAPAYEDTVVDEKQ